MDWVPGKGPVTADDARRHFRDLLDRVARGEHIPITRYGKTVAVMGPPSSLMPLDEARKVLSGEARGAD